MKKVLSMVLAVIMVPSMAACGSSAEKPAENKETTKAAETTAAGNDSSPIKIALYAPITGNNAQYGLTYQKTIEVLAEKLNEEGGINGRKVVVDVYDDKADQKEALNIANLIVSDPEVVAVVGSQTSSPTLAAAPVFAKANIPMITPNASHRDITPVGKGIFSMNCLSDFEGGKTAGVMAEDGCKKAAIIYSNDDNGVYNHTMWVENAKENGLEVVAEENFIPNSTSDFTPLLSKVKAAGADSMFVIAGYAELAMILNQMKQLEMKDVVVYSNSTSYNEAFLEAAGEAANGCRVSNFFYDESDDETFVNLKKLITEKTDISLMSVYVANSHDAFMLLVDAIREVGTDGDAIADWLANVKDWPGACGPVNFDETRHPDKHIFWFEVQDGAFKFVRQQN